jgi:hypothetical protein
MFEGHISKIITLMGWDGKNQSNKRNIPPIHHINNPLFSCVILQPKYLIGIYEMILNFLLAKNTSGNEIYQLFLMNVGI